jgi:flagellar hook-associated protein 1
LHNSRQGVDTASHNISNAQTEGYSRQNVALKQRDPLESRGNIIGNGAYVHTIKRSHDGFLEGQLNNAIQDSELSQAKLEVLSQLEPIFSTDLENSVADSMTGFFNALQDLGAYPEEQPARTNLREAAAGVVSSFRRVDDSVKQIQRGVNEQIDGSVAKANALIDKIAGLNISMMSIEAGTHHQANDMRDQQEELIRQLSSIMNIKYYKSEHGTTTIRGPGQTLLVDGAQAVKLNVLMNPETGYYDIVSSSGDGGPRIITHHLEAGELGGLVQLRDGFLNEILSNNNELSVAFANEVNQVHRQGFGIGSFSESLGRDFFTLPDDLHKSASLMDLSLAVQESTDAIAAAATPNAPGDNVIVNELLRLRSKPVLNKGEVTFNEFYANNVAKLGLVVEAARNEVDANKIVMADFQKRKDAVSGVSLDEEAVNLLRWQTAFAASSKVITTVDEMLETLLSIKR